MRYTRGLDSGENGLAGDFWDGSFGYWGGLRKGVFPDYFGFAVKEAMVFVARDAFQRILLLRWDIRAEGGGRGECSELRGSEWSKSGEKAGGEGPHLGWICGLVRVG